jgi:protein-disulfide isomerase
MLLFVRMCCLCLALLASAAPARAADRAVNPATIPIVVFSAYTCPYCAQAHTMLARLQAKYPGRLRLIYKNFPLGRGADALLPHQAVIAAAEQGKMGAMHDALFEAAPDSLDRDRLRALASRLKLDQKRFLSALDAPSTRALIDDDVAEAQALKVNATPTFYIEGFKLEGLHQADVFEQIIEHKLAALEQGRAQ